MIGYGHVTVERLETEMSAFASDSGLPAGAWPQSLAVRVEKAWTGADPLIVRRSRAFYNEVGDREFAGYRYVSTDGRYTLTVFND